jgi:hypothetical protein
MTDASSLKELMVKSGQLPVEEYCAYVGSEISTAGIFRRSITCRCICVNESRIWCQLPAASPYIGSSEADEPIPLDMDADCERITPPHRFRNGYFSPFSAP